MFLHFFFNKKLTFSYHISDKVEIFSPRKHSGLIYGYVPQNFVELLIEFFDLDKPKSPITNLPSLFMNMFLLFHIKNLFNRNPFNININTVNTVVSNPYGLCLMNANILNL